ncbi:MAG: hypothetical protein WC699_17055 [Bacteroidales bacterium]|jgi:hypothetical protein
MKIKLLILLGLMQVTLIAGAQEAQRPVVKPVRFFIGIQPGFMPTFPDQWGYTVWDLNVVPLTMEYAINRHWALRLHSIYNLGVGSYNQGPKPSNMGLEIAAPFYMSLKNSEEGHRGFYLAPIITPGYNLFPAYYTFGFGAEAGFSFLFGNKWSLSIGAQAGIKFQKIPEESFIRRIPYSIPAISLGIWL